MSPRRVPDRPLVPAANPLVVAHRGDSYRNPEHTLAAYEAAVAAGADGLECDVRLTRDGHLVCVHDRTVDRTSNGHGPVSELDLSRLESLDFASWHGEPGLRPTPHTGVWPDSADDLLADEEYLSGVQPEIDPATGTVLRLETLLGLVADAPRRLQLLVETKHPTRYAGLVEKELVRTLRRFGHAGPDAGDQQVTVMSFASTALRRVRLLSPELPTVLLQKTWKYQRRAGELPGTTQIAGPSVRLVREDPEFVARCHERGHRVFVWTVDRPADLDLMLSLGVDAIITNRPADAVRARSTPVEIRVD